VNLPTNRGFPEDTAVGELFTPEAVRGRCQEILALGLRDKLRFFKVDLDAMDKANDRVVAEIRENYPDLKVPFHSRWRHFELGGIDLWKARSTKAGLEGQEMLAAEGDLAIISVLLDAGAGPDWSYRDDETGLTLGRSEGLALASLRLFESGALSTTSGDPLRADAEGLASLTTAKLGKTFQEGPGNPLIGLRQRAELLRRLGQTVSDRPDLFLHDNASRPGHLLTYLAEEQSLKARDILRAVLDGLMPIWPSPLRIAGMPLGDVGLHPLLVRRNDTNGIIPFHKLSQWLSYSLIEPLQKFGVNVENLDGLTGLPEYRNGGLFVDTGVLNLRDPAATESAYDPSSELIVEWRALTVTLLDLLAEDVRQTLKLTAEELPLASILQGGTWSAGRTIAAEIRPGGDPPIMIKSDATVF
jgi:hypothetical protein